MSWLDLFRAKLMTAEEAVSAVRSGQRVYIHPGCAAPIPLVEALLRRSSGLRQVEMAHMLTFGPADYTRPEYEGRFRHNGLFLGGNVRQAVAEGRAATTVLSFVLDWSPSHLLNPLWHPHARFHGALLLFMLAGVSGTSIWLLWRESSEPEVALRVSAFLALSFWTPLFYITSVLPGSTSWAGAPDADPRLRGGLVTPNLIVAAVFVLITVIGLLLSYRGNTPRRALDSAVGGSLA